MMEQVFKTRRKYNQRKNIVNNIYDPKNIGLKNFNMCNCKIIKFIPEKVYKAMLNIRHNQFEQVDSICDTASGLYNQQKVNKCSYQHYICLLYTSRCV